MNSNNDLGAGSIGRHLTRLAIPAVAAQLVNVLYNMVDRIYVGRIPDVGATALTGLGVCMPLILLISAFAALASMGGAPRSSIKMGEGNHKEAEEILGNCTMILIALGAILTVVFLLFGDTMLMAFGASENTIGYASSYMRIYACGTIFVQLALGLNAFVTAQGFAKTSMITVIIGAVCNVVLDPIFIFGFNMGVEGAALATIISQAISAIYVLHFLTGKKTTLRIRRKNLKLSPKVILPCLALGLAPFIMQSTESIISICFNSSLLKYGGDLAVGAMTILSTVMQFSFLPLVGLTQGAQPIISYNFGAKNADRVKKTFKLTLLVAATYSIIMWLSVMFSPQIFIKLFTDNQELVDFSIKVIRVYMSVSVLFSVQLVCQQTFIAIGNAKTSVFLAVLRKIFLLIPLIFLLPMIFTDQVMAVFLAEPVADFIAVVTTASLFAVQFRKSLKRLSADKNAVNDVKAIPIAEGK